MTHSRAWPFAATAVIVAGAGLIALLRQAHTPPDGPPAPAVTPAASVAAAPAAEASAIASTLAPWASSALPSPPVMPHDPAQQQAMLAQMKVRTRQQAEMTDRLLAELDRRQAAHQLPAGVDMQGMRNNLLISRKLQQVSTQIQDLAGQPDGPQRQRALQARLAELQDLQRQVRLDLVSPAAATAGNR